MATPLSSQRRPRLLEVLYSFNVGGSELLGLELARQLVADGIEVLCTALQGNAGPLVADCAAHGIRVVDLGLPKRGVLARNGFSIDLARRLKALDVDCIHLQHFLGLNKLGLAAKLAGIPRVVVTEHSVLDASQSLAGRMRIRMNWRMADVIATVHPQIRDYLVHTLGVRPDRTEVVPVGVELARWQRGDRLERRRELGFADEFVFAFVGRFAQVKNVPGLVSAFLALQSRQGMSTRLALVGDGEDMPACRQIANAHPEGWRVYFAGELKDARPVLAAADAFVMNSRSEGTPRALLEAMAMELACIGPAIGGIPSMLESRGWTFPANDPMALLDAMAEVAREPRTAAMAGMRAREYVVQNYDSASIRDRYRKLLLP